MGGFAVGSCSRARRTALSLARLSGLWCRGGGSAGPGSLKAGQSPAPGGTASFCPLLPSHPPFSAISRRVWDLVVNAAVLGSTSGVCSPGMAGWDQRQEISLSANREKLPRVYLSGEQSPALLGGRVTRARTPGSLA